MYYDWNMKKRISHLSFLGGVMKKSPLECHGTLKVNPECGCLMETECNVAVKRSPNCTNPNHAPTRTSHGKRRNDKAAQVFLALKGSAKENVNVGTD
jgi:hypothetical protein